MLVFDLPYLFRDRPHMYEVLDGPIGRSFEAPLRERGLVLLGYFEAGLRHLMTRDRAIERTEDLAGLKIRTMENPLHLRAFEAFGASPLPMAYGEVYTALEQGSSTVRRLPARTTSRNASSRWLPTGRRSAGCISCSRW